MNKQSQIVMDALREIITNPQHEEDKIALYFSPDYQQQVDGKSLDYRGFVGHMALLKALTTGMTLSVLAIAGDENTVFTHHHVKVDKKSGQQSEIAVMARFTLASGRIVRCDELTRLLVGEPEDRDLGSRG
ncbi:nuclear transport factor 2 family protein [Raoultella sp. C349492]|uniref:nuclear transport factor 2 family protein n=1 Tax=Raoultella sp. C349492 TaxID=2970253 RepID=UPI0035C7406F